MRGLFGFVFLWATVVSAAPEFVPIQERAQGHSLAGSNLMNDSLYSNPAASTFVSTYTVDANLTFPKSFAVSILDTQTSAIGGAGGYFREQYETSSVFRQGVKLSLAQKVSDTVGFGIAGKAVWGPYGSALPSGEYATTEYKDMDVGVLWNPGGFQLGMAMRNLLGGSPLMGQEREYVVGGRIAYQDTMFLSLATQMKNLGSSPYEYGIGAEYVSPWFFSIKGGYRYQTEVNNGSWSAGASFLSPRMSVHYAVEFKLAGGTDHTLGTTLVF